MGLTLELVPEQTHTGMCALAEVLQGL